MVVLTGENTEIAQRLCSRSVPLTCITQETGDRIGAWRSVIQLSLQMSVQIMLHLGSV